MNDYESNLNNVSKLPKFYLGQEVDSPNGKGIITNLDMSSNGLYLSPERSTAVVWHGCDSSKTSMVQEQYSLEDLNKFNKKLNNGL